MIVCLNTLSWKFAVTSKKPANNFQGAVLWNSTGCQGGTILQRASSKQQHLVLNKETLHTLDMGLWHKKNPYLKSLSFTNERRCLGGGELEQLVHTFYFTLICPTVSFPVTSRVWVFWARTKSCILMLEGNKTDVIWQDKYGRNRLRSPTYHWENTDTLRILYKGLQSFKSVGAFIPHTVIKVINDRKQSPGSRNFSLTMLMLI